MNKTGSENGLIDATNMVEQKLKKAFPEIKYTFFEPDRGREIHEYEEEDEDKEKQLQTS